MARVKRSGPGIAALKTEIANLERKRAEVGFFDTARYPDGTPVAYIATIQEFGSPQNGIPPRSFMRSTIQEQRAAWRDTLAKGAKRVISGKMTTLQMFEAFGMKVAGQIKKKISEITDPGLSPITLELRALKKQGVKISGKVVGIAAADYALDGLSAAAAAVSNKPLVDTGTLISSVDSKVADK